MAPLYPTRSEFIIGNDNENIDHNDDRMKRLFKVLFHNDWKNTYSLSHSEQVPVFLDSLSSLTRRNIDSDYWQKVLYKTYLSELQASTTADTNTTKEDNSVR
jgi:hypothetical protein